MPVKTRTRKPRTPSPNAAGLRIWREREVLETFGVGRTTLWRWVRDGIFPAPLRLGLAAKGWTDQVIRKHFDDLAKKQAAA